MTKIQSRKGKIHPSPPPSSAAFLPATILTLAACLSPGEREVLSYLLTANKTSSGGVGSHKPEPHCGCFECYTSYWVRWDTSPNRHVIDEILEAYEELVAKKKKRKSKKRSCRKESGSGELDRVDGSGEEASRDGEAEKGAVRKIVGFIGEKFWGVWGKY